MRRDSLRPAERFPLRNDASTTAAFSVPSPQGKRGHKIVMDSLFLSFQPNRKQRGFQAITPIVPNPDHERRGRSSHFLIPANFKSERRCCEVKAWHFSFTLATQEKPSFSNRRDARKIPESTSCQHKIPRGLPSPKTKTQAGAVAPAWAGNILDKSGHRHPNREGRTHVAAASCRPGSFQRLAPCRSQNPTSVVPKTAEPRTK